MAVEVSTGLDDAVNDTIGATEMAPLPLLWYVATDVDDAQSEERALVDTTGDDDVVLLMEVNAVAIATDVLDTSGDTVRDAYAVIDDRALIDTSTDKVRFGEGLITGDDEIDEVLKAEAETVRVALTVGGPVDAGDKVGEFFGDAESVCPAEMLGKEEAAAVFDGTVADALTLSRDDDVALADDSGDRDGLVVVDENTVSDALPDWADEADAATDFVKSEVLETFAELDSDGDADDESSADSERSADALYDGDAESEDESEAGIDWVAQVALSCSEKVGSSDGDAAADADPEPCGVVDLVCG